MVSTITNEVKKKKKRDFGNKLQNPYCWVKCISCDKVTLVLLDSYGGNAYQMIDEIFLLDVKLARFL